MDIGIQIPEILLPKKGIELRNWSVVACDQYTSEPEYWKKVKEAVGASPSTLNIIYPEVYLEENLKDKKERIKNILNNMDNYLKDKFEIHEGVIYVDRKTTHAESRKGLMVAIDLEKYDFNKGSQTLIRATEGTVLERLPPRIEIRKDATLESPHIMILIDDPKKTVIEPIAKKAESGKLKKIYDFELMMNSGHVKGFSVDATSAKNAITSLEKLAEPKTFNAKYNTKDKKVLLFAVGDGNHSLATAKSCWELFKKNLNDKEKINHPARFALIELVNVHDKGLEFEPIHRVIFDIDFDEMIKEMGLFYEIQNSVFEYAKKEPKHSKPSKIHTIKITFNGNVGFLIIKNPKLNLEVGTLQSFLDYYKKKLEANKKIFKVDYIHGEDVVEKLSNETKNNKGIGAKTGNVGFFLPAMNKTDLFKTVILDGALPRKTFSMGEASEKRFYLECRKIR